jgi:hypothetical protein
VKKVLIHGRDTIEIWYCLPNSQRFANSNIWLPECNSLRTRPWSVEPEIWFRIIHTAQAGYHGPPVATYREQSVEIALGPKGAFENGNIGALTRRVPGDRGVCAVPLPRGKSKSPKEPRTPRVVELLCKAIEWHALLDSGKVANQAEIARREGITRARVTQIMGLRRLAPEIQKYILALPNSVCRFPVTERMLRPIETVVEYRDQLIEFHNLLA